MLTRYLQSLRRCPSSRASSSLVLAFLSVSLVSLLGLLSESLATLVSGVLHNNQGSTSEWLVYLPRSDHTY